jgi:pSer/pThr/pTyr-binding forkhead associated (FHA) protein
MGGSTADTPTTPEYLRASDAERDNAVSELRNEFAEGRLSHETFMYRMQSALDARHRGQLAGLFTDLPPRRPGLMARIRAMLRGEDPEARESRPDGGLGIPRTQQIAGRPVGQAPPWIAPPQPGSQSPPAPPANPPANPAPLVFPPGSGVRFTIGRTRDCDLCLTDLSVSRMHALLVRREGGWVLSDLGSHNGTRLNGWLVREPVQVHAGDRVEFGSMAFIIGGDPPAVPLPAGDEEEEEPGLAGTGP